VRSYQVSVGSVSAAVLLDNLGREHTGVILNTGPDPVFIGPATIDPTGFPLAMNAALNLSEIMKGKDMLYGICDAAQTATVAVLVRAV
jgi:hypothetical protein